jgi:hypothetical protein
MSSDEAKRVTPPSATTASIGATCRRSCDDEGAGMNRHRLAAVATAGFRVHDGDLRLIVLVEREEWR